MTTTNRGGRREGAGSKPKPPAEVASVRIVANVTPAEAEEWARRGRTHWLRAELRSCEEMEYAVQAGDAVLLEEQAVLLRACRRAIDQLLESKPMLGAFNYGTSTLGNLRAELYEFRPQGIFGETQRKLAVPDTK